MTVISMIPNDAPNFLSKVTDVSKDVLRNFPHSKKVGNYLLGNTLGEGSFAKVKEALHIPTGERVAVKIIDKKKSREDSYVRRNLRREGKILQMIHHPHVVQLLEIMETQNSYYLVTELCKGGDLMDHISRKRRLLESEVKKYVRQIVSAVDYLHRSGILHRDLKIENLLLDEYKDIKIIDFGLSNCIKIVHTKEGPKAQEYCVTQCGSPAYAAPELLGRQKYGPQVDVWSIGVNMYAMLTGNLPFSVDPFNIKALHNKMINGQMNPMPEGASKECKDIIKRFLNPDPDRRISLEETFKHPWITEAPGVPMPRALYPNKVKKESLDNNIVKHMTDNQGFRTGEIIKFVIGNIPSSATAMYYLILKKLNRQTVNMRASRKPVPDHRKLHRAQQELQIPVTGGAVNNRNTSMSPTRGVTKNVPVKAVAQQQHRDTNNDNGHSDRRPCLEKEETDVPIFTDISKSPDGSRTARTASPSRQQKDTTRQPCQTKLPNVATKYAIQKRRVVTANVSTRNGYRGEYNEGTSRDTRTTSWQADMTDNPFRRRASTFPDKVHRQVVTVNKLVNKDWGAIGVVSTKDKDRECTRVIISDGNSNKPTAKNNTEPVPSRSVSPATKINSQYVVLSKRTRMISRNSANTSNTAISKEPETSGTSNNEDDYRSSSMSKHLLSRISRTSRIPRAKLVTRNDLATEGEQVSEISPPSTRTLSSRNTNVSSNLSRPSSAGLPMLLL